MSETVIAKGFIAILKNPIDSEQRDELMEKLWDEKSDLRVNYEGTLVYSDENANKSYRERENIYGIQFPKESNSDGFMTVLAERGFEVEVGSLMPYTCIWYTGVDCDVNMLTVDQYREELKA